MYLHATNYQNIPSGLKDSDFHKLITDGRTCLGDDIYKEIWHLTISLVRLCQYMSACQKIIKIFQAV